MNQDISFDHFSAEEASKLAVVFVAGSLASAIGVGGGAIYTVLFITLFGLVYEAIPLSKVAVLAAAISLYLQNVVLPLPKETGHVHRFAYDVVMVMEPATLLGTVYGVLASKIVPYWLITAIISLLLSFSAMKTFKKARKIRTEELSQHSKDHMEEAVSLLPQSKSMNGSQSTYGTITDPNEVNITMAEKQSLERPRYNWLLIRSVMTIISCFLIIAANSILNSSLGTTIVGYEIECGSATFYIAIAILSILTFLITWLNISYLHWYQAAYSTSSPERSNLTVVWDDKTSKELVLLCFVAGFLSSLCGVGGSTIKNPILLHLNLTPVLAKATSQFMLLTTVGASALQFYLIGSIPQKYFITFFCMALVSSVFGKTVVDYYVRKTARQSVIVYLLGFYITFSMIAMTSIGVIIVIGQLKDIKHLDIKQIWFRGPCEVLPPDYGALKLIIG